MHVHNMYKIRVRVGAETTPFYSWSGRERGSFSLRFNFFFLSCPFPLLPPPPHPHHLLLSIPYHSFFYCIRAWIQRLSTGIFLAWKTVCLLYALSTTPLVPLFNSLLSFFLFSNMGLNIEVKSFSIWEAVGAWSCWIRLDIGEWQWWWWLN